MSVHIITPGNVPVLRCRMHNGNLRSPRCRQTADVASRVDEDMVTELEVHTIELFMHTLVILRTT